MPVTRKHAFEDSYKFNIVQSHKKKLLYNSSTPTCVNVIVFFHCSCFSFRVLSLFFRKFFFSFLKNLKNNKGVYKTKIWCEGFPYFYLDQYGAKYPPRL